MKKVSLILLLTIILFSCRKDDDVTVITENITISNTETYKYDLGGFGDEDGARISKQAEHYEISGLTRKDNIVYTYKPKEGFIGSDLVKIEIKTGSDGSGSDTGKVTKIVQINFMVTL